MLRELLPSPFTGKNKLEANYKELGIRTAPASNMIWRKETMMSLDGHRHYNH